MEAMCNNHLGCTSSETSARLWMRNIATQVVMLGQDIHDQDGGRRSCLPVGNMGARPTREILDLIKGLVGENDNDIDAVLRKIIEAAGLDPNTWGICTEKKKELT